MPLQLLRPTLPRCWSFLMLALLCSGDALPAPASPALHPFVANYTVRTAGLKVGAMRRQLTLDATAGYRLESTLEPSGLAAFLHAASVIELSEGSLDAGGPKPLIYAYRRIAKRKRKELESRFDWSRREITTNDRGNISVFAAAPGALDKLSYQLALMLDLARGRTTFEYLVADTDHLKTYTLADEGGETLEVLGRPVATRKLVYARAGSGRRTTLWCAAEYGHMPVQIEYREDDGTVTLATLSSSE